MLFTIAGFAARQLVRLLEIFTGPPMEIFEDPDELGYFLQVRK